VPALNELIVVCGVTPRSTAPNMLLAPLVYGPSNVDLACTLGPLKFCAGVQTASDFAFQYASGSCTFG
jgi:hypothetical protein